MAYIPVGITLSLNQPQYLVVENDTSLIVTLTLNRIACEDAVVEVTISDGSAYGMYRIYVCA